MTVPYIKDEKSMAKSVFNGINTDDLADLLNCLDTQRLNFKENDIISADEIFGRLFVVQSGDIRTITIDEDGTRTILSYYNDDDIIIPQMLYTSKNITCFLEILDNCEILSLDLKRVNSCCESACKKHIIFLSNLLLKMDTILYDNASHTAVISNRSIRKKLCEYFEIQKNINRSVKFKLPMTMAELADYLCVDRSAMLREIKKMCDEKLIVSKNRHITLLV